MTVEASVTWVEDRRFVGVASSGHAIVVDGSGLKTGPSPMELLLMGGVDKRILRDGCGKQAIEEHVRAVVEPLVAQGGYSPFVDHAVPHDVPFENFRYYMELIDDITTSG